MAIKLMIMYEENGKGGWREATPTEAEELCGVRALKTKLNSLGVMV